MESWPLDHQGSSNSDLFLWMGFLLVCHTVYVEMGFPVGSDGKEESRLQSVGWEDPLEEGMATHSHILTWEIPWTEEPGRLQSMGSHKVGHDLMTKHIHYFICGNKSPTKGEQQNLIIRACYSNKVSHCHLCFSAESKVGRGEEKFIAEKGSLQTCLEGRLLARGSRLAGSGTSDVIGYGYIYGFLWSVLSSKQG